MSIRPFRDIKRRKTKEINVGNVKVGGNNPISVDITSSVISIMNDMECRMKLYHVPDIVQQSAIDEPPPRMMSEVLDTAARQYTNLP